MSKDKNQHVNVFVRIKPLNKQEILEEDHEKLAVPVVQIASEKEIIVYDRSQEKVAKKFTFDKVFSPTSTQLDVYNAVIRPLLKELLAGYSCTVFAYGQTGAGKTYTMVGDRVEDPGLHWQSNTSVGMIPRCLSHLFDELQLLKSKQYVVKVNFLELYNEELFDLLSPNSYGSSKVKLYDDISKKSSIIIHGLKEVTVRNKTEVYNILEKGWERRQTASTLMNVNSSRSHTVFSITVHTKEDIPEGQELLRMAKLNLVDLAGSENIGKSGAVDKRARETRNINRSLLTLGRVITALVEKAPHIPYRESKLTRLLQESLGGCTKTSIIATISSMSSNVDETLSTLDYAHRAKNITNWPEINQKLSKRTMLEKYTKEIERLKKDLMATRNKNGIYLSQDKYDSMHALINWQKKKLQEQNNDIKLLEESIENKQKRFDDLQSQLDDQTKELMNRTSKLNDLTHSTQSLQDALKEMKYNKDERKYLVEMYAATKKILHSQAETLLNVVTEASEETQKLHDELDRKSKMEEENRELALQMKSDLTKPIKSIEDNLAGYTKDIGQFFSSIKDEVESHLATQVKTIKEQLSYMPKDLITSHLDMNKQLIKDIANMYARYYNIVDANVQSTNVIECEKKLLTAICSRMAPAIQNLVKINGSFAQSLKNLNDDISLKLEDISACTKDTVELAYKYRLKECNSFRENISEIKEHINCMFLNQKEIIKNHKLFSKKMEHFSNDFIYLDRCENNYAENVNRSYQIDKICNNICDEIVKSCNTDINKQDNLQQLVQSNVSQIKSKIDDKFKEAQISEKIVMEKGKSLTSAILLDFKSNRIIWEGHNNQITFNIQKLLKNIIEDKSRTIITTDIISKIVEDMSFTYSKFMIKQQFEMSDFSTIMINKLTAQNTELINWNDKSIKELRTSQQQMKEFFIKNLYCDVETGATSPRKEFLYSRELATTLPHEQLIQKFRGSRKCIEEDDDSDLTLMIKSASEELLSLPDITISNISHKDYSSSPCSSTANINLHSRRSNVKEISKFGTLKKSVLNLSRISSPLPQSETGICKIIKRISNLQN